MNKRLKLVWRLKKIRNQGIGAELIKVIGNLYKSMNKKAISLSVDQLNPAKALYNRNSFEVIG